MRPCTPPAAVKVISLFSPLPAAATRDRLRNTNHIDGRSRETEKANKKKGKKKSVKRVKIANRNHGIKMHEDKKREKDI